MIHSSLLVKRKSVKMYSSDRTGIGLHWMYESENYAQSSFWASLGWKSANRLWIFPIRTTIGSDPLAWTLWTAGGTRFPEFDSALYIRPMWSSCLQLKQTDYSSPPTYLYWSYHQWSWQQWNKNMYSRAAFMIRTLKGTVKRCVWIEPKLVQHNFP